MRQNVGRATLTLIPIAITSRGAAFLIPVVVALWFGVDLITDAWFWALAFPTFAVVLAGSAVATTVTPALARVKQESPHEVPQMIGGLLVWSAGLATALGLCFCLSGPWVLENFTDFETETQSLAAMFLWELLPFMVVTSAGAVLRAGCEVEGLFKRIAFTPLIRAVVVIGTTWMLLEPAGAHALPIGLILGETVQALWWGVWLTLAGVDIEPTTKLNPAIRQVGRDFAPILGGEVLVALNLVIDKGFAATLEQGSVATLEFADRARIIPTTLMISTLAMVAFATWSNDAAKGESARSRISMDKAMRWTLLLASPALAGMFIGRYALIEMMFEHGAFTPQDTRNTAHVLGYYIPGILPALMGALALRAHIVERNLALVLTLGIASVTVNFTLNSMLIGPLGLVGLALSTSVGATFIATIWILCLVPILPSGLAHRWLPSMGIVIGSALVAGICEATLGTVMSFSDTRIWLASIPCFLLLAAAISLVLADRTSGIES